MKSFGLITSICQEGGSQRGVLVLVAGRASTHIRLRRCNADEEEGRRKRVGTEGEGLHDRPLLL